MDLVPREAEFELSSKPGVKYKLEPWSLYWRTWATDKYGAERLGLIFKEQRIVEIGEMAYAMLIDKTDFPTIVDFQKAVVSMKDQYVLITSILTTVGMGEPELEKIKEEAKRRGFDPNNPTPKKEPVDPLARSPNKKKIGAKSSTR